MDKIFNKTEYKLRRQALRNNMTEPEKKLWQILRRKQMGIKFRRQHGIGHHIADFYCPELKLVIEVDGDSHRSAEAQAYDAIRQDFMASLGIITLRFSNEEVMKNIEGVHQRLMQYLKPTTLTSPTKAEDINLVPSPEKGRARDMSNLRIISNRES